MNEATPTPCQRPGANPDDWFAPVGSMRELSARSRCVNECPIFHACRQEALELGVPHGTWGGMDERTRQRVWERSPAGRPTIFDDSLRVMRGYLDRLREEIAELPGAGSDAA